MIRPAAPDPDAARRGVERTRPARTPDDPAAPIVEVVGLGPGAAELVTDGTLSVLRSGAPTFVRTRRHPSASVLPDGTVAFDDVYEQADLIESVYRTIVESLVESAEEHRRVVYAVPGSPVVAEHTVELLIADDRVRTVLHPALSFLDLTWIRLRIDPVELGVRLVDGRDRRAHDQRLRERAEVEHADERAAFLAAVDPALRDEVARLTKVLVQYKNLWALRGEALKRPCLSCGYVQKQIVPMEGSGNE